MLAEAVAVGFSAVVWPDDGAVGVGWGHNQNSDAAMDAPTTQPTMKKMPSRRAVNRGGVTAGGEGTCEEGMSWPSSGVVALVTAVGSSTKIGCVTGELQCGAGFDVSDCHKSARIFSLPESVLLISGMWVGAGRMLGLSSDGKVALHRVVSWSVQQSHMGRARAECLTHQFANWFVEVK